MALTISLAVSKLAISSLSPPRSCQNHICIKEILPLNSPRRNHTQLALPDDPATASSNSSSSSSSTAAPKEIIDRLRGFLLFSTAPEPFLEAIASRLVPQVYPARTFIITEGEEARAMYSIIKGTVAIVSRDGEANSCRAWPRRLFWRDSAVILFDCPRTASVQACERCVIAVLTAGAVNEVLPGFPQVETIIRNEAQERLAMLAKNRQQQQKLRRATAQSTQAMSNTMTDGTKIDNDAANSKSDAAATTTSADESSKKLLGGTTPAAPRPWEIS